MGECLTECVCLSFYCLMSDVCPLVSYFKVSSIFFQLIKIKVNLYVCREEGECPRGKVGGCGLVAIAGADGCLCVARAVDF